MDGNFSVEQLKMKHLENDVHLSDGDAFMVNNPPTRVISRWPRS